MIYILSKINYKLVNILLLIIIIFFLYQLFPLFKYILDILKNIFLPFIMGFVISSLIYPFVNLLKKKINRNIAVIIILILIFLIMFVTIYYFYPYIFKEVKNIYVYLLKVTTELNLSFEVKNFIMNNIEKIFIYFLNMSFKTIFSSLSVILNTIMTIVITIYFLFRYDNIKYQINKIIQKNKSVKFLDIIINNFEQHFKGMCTISIISFFEYTIIFFVIGHPCCFILGILAFILSFVPVVGSFILFVVAIFTSFHLKKVFYLCLIMFAICQIIDNYIIDPRIFRRTSSINILEVLFALSFFSALFGIVGSVLAIPLYKSFKMYFNYVVIGKTCKN